MSVLLTTLYASSLSTYAFNSLTGSGSRTPCTIAQLKDSNDATRYAFNATGDFVDDDIIDGYENFVLDTASLSGATIEKITIKIRADRDADFSSGRVIPRINNVNRGSFHAVGLTPTTYSQDFTSDPADSNPWTEAKLNAQTFGWAGGTGSMQYGGTSDPTGSDDLRISEFAVEVWGTPAPQTSTPDSTSMTATANTATQVIGARTVTPACVTMTANNATDAVFELTGLRDPETITTLLPTVDSGSVLTVVRAKHADLKDQRLDTFQSDSSAVGPSTETLTVGTSGIDPTTVTGTGTITHLVMRCYARLREGDGGSTHRPTASNARFTWNGGSAVVTVAPPSGPYSAVPDFLLLSTGAITTHDGVNPWAWGNLYSVLNFVGGQWAFKVDVAITEVGDVAQLDVAEAWLDINAPVGSVSVPIALRQRLAPVVKRQVFTENL